METTAMSLRNLSSSARLKHRIMHLTALKEEQEALIKRDIQEIKYAITPSALIRSAVQNINNDSGIRHSMVEETISKGANLLIDTFIFRKGFGIKKYLLNVGLKKLVGHFMTRKRDDGI
jgi:hypothetical protein